MERIKLFEAFEGRSPEIRSYLNMFGSLSENIAAAKSFMQREYAKKKKIDPKDLTPEEREQALDNRGYKEILKLIGDKHGYASAFVKFHFEQGVPINLPGRADGDGEIRDLASLFNLMITKKHVVSRIPMNIDQYAASDEINGVSGFEALTDAIRTIERADGAKWFTDRLPKKSRDGFRSMSPEDKNRVINAAYALEDLGKEVTERLLSKIKAMDSWTIDQVMDYTNNYLSGYSNLEMKKKMDEIAELEPGAGVLYFDDKYLAITVRTDKAQRALCSIANWCINRGSFNNYAGEGSRGKGIQVNIFDYTKDPTDPYFLTGTTISNDGRVTDSHDINDRSIKKGTEPGVHFKGLGYPQDMVDDLVKGIPIEIATKKILDSLGTANALEMIRNLIQLRKGLIAGRVSDDIWGKALQISSDIIKEDSDIKVSTIIQRFKESGIVTENGLVVFKALAGDAYTREDAKAIIEMSERNFNNMVYLLELYDEGLISNKSSDINQDAIRETIKNKDEVLAKLKEEL
jgi:hypothetical protein